MNPWLLTIGLSLCMCVGILSRNWPFKSIVTPRQGKKLRLLNGILIIANALLIYTALKIWGLRAAAEYLRYGGILFASVSCATNILVLRGWLREHLFVAGVVLNCHYLLMSVPNYLLTVMEVKDPVTGLYLIVGILFLLLAAVSPVLNKLLRTTIEPFLHLEVGDFWQTVWLFPVIFFGMRFVSLGGEHDEGSLRQLLSSLMQIGVMLLLCMSVRSGQLQHHRSRVMEKQLENQKLHYLKMMERAEEIRKLNHNLKHHAIAIRHLAENDDKAGFMEYCDSFLEQLHREEEYPYTGNHAADGILYHYMRLAGREGIRFEMKGTIRSSGISDGDLCVLLGNALDNAVTACRALESGREITVISQSEDRLLSVMIRNTFDGKVERSGETILSRKQKDRMGLGVTSMRAICQNCGGSLELQWDDTHFTLMFLIPEKQQ